MIDKKWIGYTGPEVSFDIERGTRELTAEQAMDINSYKFTYDDAGKLSAVEFVRGDELLGYSSLADAARITYEYTDNKQIKQVARVTSSGSSRMHVKSTI